MATPPETTWASVHSAAELGAFLRHVRESRGLSQEELADELGIDRRYVYQIEAGTPSLYTRRLFGLLRLLDVRMEVHAR
ncbi:helix-turn-helix transcriptional regulator [Cellulomonas sp. 179-A 9B4 NHS]|uniref:helix-turn-helix transcriptional regulator n=1 Tax=Cellulomonas sp. 179-A 9B4 NHS TaxID=3142379 RepID=UPI0039A03FE5